MSINAVTNRKERRRIDELGRVYIPKEIRQHLNIEDSSRVEVWLNGDVINIKVAEK